MTKKPAKFLFSSEALQDLEDIRCHTLENFGEKILDLYDELIFQSLHDLSLDLNRVGVSLMRELGEGCYVYPIRYSKLNSRSEKKIKKPHHCILFEKENVDRFGILGIIHDKRHMLFFEKRIKSKEEE